jgi:hypothetical protein
MSDPLTNDQLSWIVQVAADPRLPPTAARLAIAMARRFHRRMGFVSVSMPDLCATAGVSINAARRAVHAMARTGHLKIKMGGGLSANRYKPTLKTGGARP